jgi:nucleoside-diphosphate-sugar epimerase
MRILITGGLGFIGKHLVKRLSSEHEIALLALPDEKVDLTGVRIFRGDIIHSESLAQAASWPEIVIHAAGVTRALRSADFYRVNLEGTKNLVEMLARRNPGLKRLVFFSSLMAGGKPPSLELPLCECHAPRPMGAYGRSKLWAEEFLARSGLPYTILRLPSVYGPGTVEYRDIFAFAKKGLAPRLGAGEKFFSLIHVRDVAAATERILFDGDCAGQTFYLSDPNVYTWTQLEKVVCGLYPRKLKAFTIPRFAVYIAAVFYEIRAFFTRKPPVLSLEKMGALLHPFLICDSRKYRARFPDFKFSEMPQGIREMYEDNLARELF